MQVQSYLYFDGRTEEALEFYSTKLGAKVEMLLRFSEAPPPPPGQSCMTAPPAGDKIMHASFRVGDTVLLASDGMCAGKAAFQGVSLSLTANDVDEAEHLFAALGEGGQVQMSMSQTFFAQRFGMVVDRFGVNWMVLAGVMG